MKKVGSLFVAVLLGIIMALSIAGCGETDAQGELQNRDGDPSDRVGAFYTLQESYDNGWLTRDDLQTIADYHHNNNIPYPESLSEDIAKSIKKAWAEKYNEDNAGSATKTPITEEMVVIVQYYGIYNSCAIIIVDRLDAQYIDVYVPITIEIGGITFHFQLYRPKIIVWKF